MEVHWVNLGIQMSQMLPFLSQRSHKIIVGTCECMYVYLGYVKRIPIIHFRNLIGNEECKNPFKGFEDQQTTAIDIIVFFYG